MTDMAKPTITPKMLKLGKRALKLLRERGEPAGALRDLLFEKLLDHGFREWYNNPKGINLEYTILWLNACTYDRLKHTVMGKAGRWDKTDHPTSIMGEVHVGMEYNIPDNEFKLWQKSVAVYGSNGGNAGRDWPMEWTGFDIDVEVKTQTRKKPLRVNVNDIYESRYVFVRGRVPDFRFKTIGTYTSDDIESWREVPMGNGDWCYVLYKY